MNTQTVKKCARCGELNEPSDHFCSRCGFGLTEEDREKVEEEQERAEGAVVEVENETEAKILQGVLQQLRENPQEFLAE